MMKKYDLVTISDDGFGNYHMMGKNGKVYFFNHEKNPSFNKSCLSLYLYHELRRLFDSNDKEKLEEFANKYDVRGWVYY